MTFDQAKDELNAMRFQGRDDWSYVGSGDEKSLLVSGAGVHGECIGLEVAIAIIRCAKYAQWASRVGILLEVTANDLSELSPAQRICRATEARTLLTRLSEVETQ